MEKLSMRDDSALDHFNLAFDLPESGEGKQCMSTPSLTHPISRIAFATVSCLCRFWK